MNERDELIRSYDRVAEEYAAHLSGELQHKPLDRAWLDSFAAHLRGRGRVADLGCGPGHVAAYLHDRGLDVLGVDVSPGMVAVAERLHPRLDFHVGDLRALDVPDATWAGIVAFYAIVHKSVAELPAVFREFERVLRPDGFLLLAFHQGDEVVHRDELWGRSVQLDFVFFQREAVEAALLASGFSLIESITRPPYPDVEYPSHRAYILAQVRRRSAPPRT